MKTSPFCIPKKKRNYILIGITIAIIGIPSLFYYIGYRSGFDSVYFQSSSIDPIIDGKIVEGEWSRSDFIVQQYTDSENIDGDSDDYNYMYIGENDDNLYVSLDVCTDLTEYSNIDWIGILLNTDTEEELTNQDEWLNSDSTNGIFFNINSNKSFGNGKNIWDLDGKRDISNLPFDHSHLDIKYGVLADMDEYEHYNFTSDWKDGVETYDDGIATMFYMEKVPYSEIEIFALNFNLYESLLGSYDPESDTISYLEFNVSMNFYDLFPHIPSMYIDEIAEDLEFEVNFAVIPMGTYDYFQKGSLTYQERADAMEDLYKEFGMTCTARLENPLIDSINNQSIEEFELENSIEIDDTEFNFPVINAIDYLLGHDSLLEDGVLNKTLKDGNYNYFNGVFGDFVFDINLTETVKQNNGWINFTIYGLNALEDFGSDKDVDCGFAFDLFSVTLKTSDSFSINPKKINTIENHTISAGFGESPNANQDHKMVEIAIPKSELEGYNGEEISIMIVGFSGEKIKNGSIIGYEFRKVATDINFWFGAINSEIVSEDYFDTRNYYVVPVNREEERIREVEE